MNNLYLFKTTLIIILYLLMTSAGKAQICKVPSSGTAGEFSIGYGFMNVSKLQRFVPADIRKFTNGDIHMGIGAHSFRGNILYGGSVTGIIGDAARYDTVNYSLGGGSGTLEFGYLILSSEKIRIYPLLGIGGGTYGLFFSGSTMVPGTEQVNNSYQRTNINMKMFVLDASININFIPHSNFDKETNTSGGFMTGLKIGFLYSPPLSNWNFSDGDISRGASFGYHMPYIKLIIGGFQKNSRSPN